MKWAFTHTLMRAVLILATLLGVFLFSILPNPVYERLDQTVYDTLIRHRSIQDQDPRVVLVDIDEKSIAQEGAWPWPRAKVATLINQLVDQQHVAALGIDIVFPETKDGDAHLKAALNRSPVYMAQALDFDIHSSNQVGVFSGWPVKSERLPFEVVHGYIGNHSDLLTPSSHVGHISPVIDQDGIVRTVYPLACFQKKCALPLSVAMFAGMQGGAELSDIRQEALQLSLASGESLTLPINRKSVTWIPFSVKKEGYQVISATHILGATQPNPILQNAIVILGSTSLGLGDFVATPIGPQTPGFLVHAELLSALLDHDLIATLISPIWIGTLLAVIALSFLVLPWRHLKGVAGITLTWVVLILTVGFYFMHHQLLLPVTSMLLLSLLLGLLTVLLESARAAQQLGQLSHQVSRFIPEALVKRLLRGKTLDHETKRRELTVLVADMRGFTTASEGKTSEEVALLAQQCLKTLTKVVGDYGGTIEKYSGDGLMAIWGAPKYDAQHAQHAVEAGIEMQREVAKLAPWFVAHDFKPMKVSVGINTGEMAVGVFGGESHLAWTAHGDAVNVASRIEQLTRAVGVHLLIGQRTAELYGIDRVTYCGDHHVKGRHGLVSVFSVDAL